MGQRTPGGEEQDSIREEQQRSDHVDRHDGPPQQEPAAPLQVPDYDLEAQPVEHGRQPARPGQPGRFMPHPGQRDAPGRQREPEERPEGQHEKV
jgi:hypothetical protein